jgi:hypothetical protein
MRCRCCLTRSKELVLILARRRPGCLTFATLASVCMRQHRRQGCVGSIASVTGCSTCILIHCRRTRGRPLMPPTGSSGLPWRWHPRPSCMPRGGHHPGGEVDRWSRCRERAAGTPAGTSGCRRGSRTGSRMAGTSADCLETPRQSGAGEGIRAGEGHQPEIIQRAEASADGQPSERRGRVGRVRSRSLGHRKMRLPGASVCVHSRVSAVTWDLPGDGVVPG